MARSAPGPQASARMDPAAKPIDIVAGPSAVRVARITPPVTKRMVRSPGPRHSGASVRRRSNGAVGCRRRTAIAMILTCAGASRASAGYLPNLAAMLCWQPLAMTQDLIGVAHRSLPCGTLITFRNPVNGRTLTVPVVDRGPYVYARQWDLTGGACLALGHCYTGAFQWRYARAG